MEKYQECGTYDRNQTKHLHSFHKRSVWHFRFHADIYYLFYWKPWVWVVVMMGAYCDFCGNALLGAPNPHLISNQNMSIQLSISITPLQTRPRAKINTHFHTKEAQKRHPLGQDIPVYLCTPPPPSTYKHTHPRGGGGHRSHLLINSKQCFTL